MGDISKPLLFKVTLANFMGLRHREGDDNNNNLSQIIFTIPDAVV